MDVRKEGSEGHTSCFQFGVMMKKAVKIFTGTFLLGHKLSNQLGKYLGV